MSAVELVRTAPDTVEVTLRHDDFDKGLVLTLSNMTPEQAEDEATLLSLVAKMVEEQGGGSVRGVLVAAGGGT